MGQKWGYSSIPQISSEIREINYIVFSSGGIKGVSFCGALTELHSLHISGKINLNLKGYAGCSAGSIIAALLAIGYTFEELNEIIYKINTSDFIDNNMSYFQEGMNLYNKFGVIEGTFIDNFMAKLITEKTGDSNYTFLQLYQEKAIELTIVATNLTKSKAEYFNHENSIPIKQAIRMSIGIPYLYVPINHNNCYYIDGVLTNGYPINVFNSDKILGFHIISEDDRKMIDETGSNKIESISEFTNAIILTVMLEKIKNVLDKNAMNTIMIHTPNYGISQFSLTNEEKNILIKCGTDAVQQFFG